jgi:hypothetical protein
MDNEDAPSSVNFIPCVKWVRKGVAKEIPEKVSRMDIEILKPCHHLNYVFLLAVRLLITDFCCNIIAERLCYEQHK